MPKSTSNLAEKAPASGGATGPDPVAEFAAKYAPSGARRRYLEGRLRGLKIERVDEFLNEFAASNAQRTNMVKDLGPILSP